ncbi:MAG: bis(5'-nucleosyl)-tetraphosphatase (symmetrical) YqeK [Clostridia bacterium]|nr:bis(5'-nucleosyl)-tetraphosphatase (symmetrical) YqeK [Clostridia bacterium]
MHGEYKEYKQILKNMLNEDRYYHSLCVADEAYRLAQKYGADTEKAYLAGLLHDITKNAPKDVHFDIFKMFGQEITELEENAPKLWHAISGSLYVKNILRIDDPEIIEAIRYHTTSKRNIPFLILILYLADFTSADRDYDDVDVMRKLVDVSLDGAYKYALEYTVKDLEQRNLPVHPDTVDAYNEIKNKEI